MRIVVEGAIPQGVVVRDSLVFWPRGLRIQEGIAVTVDLPAGRHLFLPEGAKVTNGTINLPADVSHDGMGERCLAMMT